AAPLVRGARRLERARELVGGLADQVRAADARAELPGEGAEVLTLQGAAQDEPERGVVGGDAAAGGGGVRGRRVADLADAAERAGPRAGRTRARRRSSRLRARR